MLMNGEYLETLQDLKRCFCIDEEHKKAEQIRNISENNALLLIRLYNIFDLHYEDSEEKIRRDYASVP